MLVKLAIVYKQNMNEVYRRIPAISKFILSTWS